jgi:hypothetical protein
MRPIRFGYGNPAANLAPPPEFSDLPLLAGPRDRLHLGGPGQHDHK